MATWTYRLNHDLGFAPNPFFRWCTLACCKPGIRRNAKVGDIIVGIAGSDSKGLGAIFPQVIYWMQVQGTLKFDEYWRDPRFASKRPRIPGPKIGMVGDRTYRHNAPGDDWSYETSMHNIPGVASGEFHCRTDTSVDRILLSRCYSYWGGEGPPLPTHLLGMFSNPRGEKRRHDAGLTQELHDFIGLDSPLGLVGRPADWGNVRYFS